ncbi:MAG TPA: protein kinase [Chloroflexota bacterium]|nr:protein kinase [Chloroflexota bacterium]
MAEIKIGTKFGEQDRYEIVELLGRGGMADVYLAQDQTLNRQVALKFIAEHMTRQPEFVTRFLAEARILASLQHANIVQVHDVGELEGRPFLMMQYIQGRSLFDLKTEGPWPADRVLAWLRGLASALDYAHDRNVLHRDIKSANIMISKSDDVATLTDFGVAAFVADALITSHSTPPDGSRGTLAYASPEQIENQVPGRPSDIHSLGVVIYEALAGRLPFEANDVAALTHKILNEQPPPLTSINPLIPAGVAAAVERALRKKPEERYVRAQDFATQFAAGLRQSPPTQVNGLGRVPYTTLATKDSPALIIYLLDLSRSMNTAFGATTRVQAVKDALNDIAREIVSQSTKGGIVSPRYRLAILGYSDGVVDLFTGQPVVVGQTGSVKSITEIALKRLIAGLKIEIGDNTNTAAGLEAVEAILKQELPKLEKCPAPLVCHLTDGIYTTKTADPEPVARRIKDMRVPDGNVLVETVFMSDSVWPSPITNIHQWRGIDPSTKLVDKYAEKLRSMSSVLPETWRVELNRQAYPLNPNSVMLLPGTSTDLVRLAFQMSGLSGTAPSR